MNILIAGATGNLGSLLTKHLLSSPHHLRLLTHQRALPFDLPAGADAEIVQADLNQPASLRTVCEHIDCIVYLAGVLFQPHPEKFLRRTNKRSHFAAGVLTPPLIKISQRGCTPPFGNPI